LAKADLNGRANAGRSCVGAVTECRMYSDGGLDMPNAAPAAAAIVPVAIELLALFVLIVAGATIALLMWRASHGKFNYPHP
jgi:hypothetical protein